MSAGEADQIHSVLVGEARTLAISFANLLDELNSETLTGTPTFAQYEYDATTNAWIVSDDLTIGSIAVSTATVRVNELDVRLGAVVLARVSGALANVQYKLVCTATSTSTPAQTLLGAVKFMGVQP